MYLCFTRVNYKKYYFWYCSYWHYLIGGWIFTWLLLLIHCAARRLNFTNVWLLLLRWIYKMSVRIKRWILRSRLPVIGHFPSPWIPHRRRQSSIHVSPVARRGKGTTAGRVWSQGEETALLRHLHWSLWIHKKNRVWKYSSGGFWFLCCGSRYIQRMERSL